MTKPAGPQPRNNQETTIADLGDLTIDELGERTIAEVGSLKSEAASRRLTVPDYVRGARQPRTVLSGSATIRCTATIVPSDPVDPVSFRSPWLFLLGSVLPRDAKEDLEQHYADTKRIARRMIANGKSRWVAACYVQWHNVLHLACKAGRSLVWAIGAAIGVTKLIEMWSR